MAYVASIYREPFRVACTASHGNEKFSYPSLERYKCEDRRERMLADLV